MNNPPEEAPIDELRAQLAAILESSHDAIIGKSLQGIVTSWNHGAERIFGYRADEAIGRSILMLLPPDRAAEEDAILLRIRRGERVEPFESVRVRRDGTPVAVAVTVAPLRDRNGLIFGACKTARDLTAQTERAQAEEAVRVLNVDLERRVKERTIQLETANRELEAFSYSISHDLRSPLRALDGYSLAVLEESGSSLNELSRRYLELIRQEAQRMAQLIDDLLKFSQQGRQKVQLQPVAMAGVARTALERLSAERANRQIEIVWGELPNATGDPVLLQQVWINLWSNAVKYTRLRAEARIEAGSFIANGRTVYFLRDNGAGFNLRYAGKLFGVFQRFHRAEEYEGTGVGLAIVHQIIQRHGGDIWAEAEVGKGAAFYFTLGAKRPP